MQTHHHCRQGGRTVPTRPCAIPVGAKKLARHGSSTGISAKKLAQRAQKRRIWGVLSLLGELFRAYAHARPSRANFFAPGMARSRSRNDHDHYDTFIQST